MTTTTTQPRLAPGQSVRVRTDTLPSTPATVQAVCGNRVLVTFETAVRVASRETGYWMWLDRQFVGVTDE